MKVLFMTSGIRTIHRPLELHIRQGLEALGVDLVVFDLAYHLYYQGSALAKLKEEEINLLNHGPLHRLAAAPVLYELHRLKPDLLLCFQGSLIPPEIPRAARDLGILSALWSVDDPYEVDLTMQYAGAYDLVFTVEAAAVPFYRKALGVEAHYLPLGCNPDFHRPTEVPERYRSDVCFIGSAFYNRLELVDQMADYLAESGLKIRILGQWWDQLKHYNRLHRFIDNVGVTPQEAVRFYCGARINLNLHRAPNATAYVRANLKGLQAKSPNNRTFEIAACGAFQLVEQRSDLGQAFTVGEELDRFDGPVDLVAKIEHYLRHDEQRRAMAERARQRAAREHSYAARLRTVLEIAAEYRAGRQDQSIAGGHRP